METVLDPHFAVSSENMGASVRSSVELPGVLHFWRGGKPVRYHGAIGVPGNIDEGQTRSDISRPMHRLDFVAHFHRRIGTQIHCLGAAQPQSHEYLGFLQRLQQRSSAAPWPRCGSAVPGPAPVHNPPGTPSRLPVAGSVGTQNQMPTGRAGALQCKGMMRAAFPKFAREAAHTHPGCQLRS